MRLKSLKEIRKQIPENQTNEADILIAEAINKDRAFVLAHPEYKPTFWQTIKINLFLKRYSYGLPIAYITGHKEFYGLDFFVSKNVLIPRPETEMLVSLTLEELVRGRNKLNKCLLIDAGTGTGCIPISISKNTINKISIFATDNSHTALRVAKKNAKRHHADIKFFCGDLLLPMTELLGNTNIETLIITANLPYLTGDQYKKELSIQYEPKSALIADNSTGFSLYERLFEQALRIKTKNLFLFCEIDPRQSDTAYKMAKNYFPNGKIEIKKDLSGRDRVIIIKND